MSNDKMREALKKAFQFGQNYWRYADSEMISHHKKSEKIKRDFDAFVEETATALTRQPESRPPSLGGVIVTDAQMHEFRQRYRHVGPAIAGPLAQQPESELHARISELKAQLEQDSKEIEIKEHCIIQCEKRIAELEEELVELKQPESDRPWIELAACLYQACGAYGLPERILDALSLAQRGEPFGHLIDGLLPCCPQPSAQVPDGWHIGIEADGTAIIKMPDGGGVCVSSSENEIARIVLRQLAEALLAAPSLAEKENNDE